LPVAILLFTAFFASLPAELEEAAKLDGFGPRDSTSAFSCRRAAGGGHHRRDHVLNTWNEFLMAICSSWIRA